MSMYQPKDCDTEFLEVSNKSREEQLRLITNALEYFESYEIEEIGPNTYILSGFPERKRNYFWDSLSWAGGYQCWTEDGDIWVTFNKKRPRTPELVVGTANGRWFGAYWRNLKPKNKRRGW